MNRNVTGKDTTEKRIVSSEKPASDKIVTEAPVSEKIMISEKPVSNKNYSQLIKQINEYTMTQPGFYGIYFKDLDSGAVFDINGNEPITAASLVKVPAVLYLNTLIDQGELNWDDTVAYESGVDYQSGAGTLQFSARDGDEYSLRTLANLSITVSDNIAYRMIVRKVGKDNLANFMRSLGGETVFPGGWNITTAEDMGKYVEAILKFNEKNPEMGQKLLYDMAHSIYNVGLNGRIDKSVTVSHKEGDVTGVANDAGIVFAERPYILVVLTKNVDDIDRGFERIAEISRIVYDYHINEPA
ncbi:MAG TPA: serine hydrolase [Desulfotomaculum sp.]|nr:serine hydrolase [Desulfotomaculum sp.]